MFENKTFELLMEQALDRVTDDLDKREEGIIYSAISPVVAEMAQMYIALKATIDLIFADTSVGEWLEKRTAEVHVFRKPAIKAIRRVMFNVQVVNGERFFVDGVHYKVIEQGKVECEEVGSIGNRPLTGSAMLPLNNIEGLQVAELGEIIIAGTEEETDASLLERYLVERRKEAGSANKAHYKKWAEEVTGVGKAIVFPLWNGRGTVKIVIVNAEMQPASPELIQTVKDYIDPVDGMGEGQAPVGATVTVVSAIHKDITVSANVSLKGNNIAGVTAEVETELKQLLKNIAFVSKEFKVSDINGILSGNEWIDDYSNVQINGLPNNLVINSEEIPNLVTVILNG
ncbi:baseplate J/gp47 family protein [Metabacillus fastidiosus]|uniref:baseplate J/gp47 family protein n=1 Tax=Metabacillus fastidiosus TaxID=1458 RepID=UPI003D2D24F4